MHESEFAQSCPTLRDPMDYSLPGSSVHAIFQARALKWVAIASSNPGFGTMDFVISGKLFNVSEIQLPIKWR